MNKSVSSLVLVGALALGSVLPLTAHAEKVTATSGETTSDVTFEAPENVVNPVDPNNPGTTVTDPDGTKDPGGATVDPTGPLSFLYVSPAISFGSQKAVSSNTQDITNADKPGQIKVTSQKFNGTDANTNLVTEVSDTRGTNVGWNVQVSSTPLTLKGATDVLKGATINLGANDTAKNTVNNSGDPTGIDGQDAALSTKDGNAATIYTAAKDAGAGQTAFQLSPDNITMTGIEANAKTGTYEGTLTWTLNDTPVE
ncbi:WxL domain-containing protein [Lactiplantibacillus songbeiensis]|uniref:WxL domain-containing protein n=1 Tax=Lactiplantibacillus songbeiensis TaxID=2559920 RepID=A0ABW4C3N4_9LACO|nr:WxL domain-containing protein [Lactiplantibacillus songbeiensis]